MIRTGFAYVNVICQMTVRTNASIPLTVEHLYDVAIEHFCLFFLWRVSSGVQHFWRRSNGAMVERIIKNVVIDKHGLKLRWTVRSRLRQYLLVIVENVFTNCSSTTLQVRKCDLEYIFFINNSNTK